jgi:protein SCO1/2
MLITSIQLYESHLDEASQARLRVLLVSFDAAHDTPEQLDRLARLHRADPSRWTFANASESDSRRIAALLGVRYRRLPDGSFDHSLLITLLDAKGRVLASTTKLIGDAQFQARVQAATSSDPRLRSLGDRGPKDEPHP